MISNSVGTLANRPAARQFVKFCIVGLSSFIIDIGLLNLFFYGLHWPLLLSKAFSFLVAVGNGFYWNRRWTFRATEGDAKKQYPVFVMTNTVGLILNLSIMTGMILLATRLGFIHTDRAPGEIVELILSGQGRQAFNPLTVNLATIIATVFVTAWNFTASRLWTFRQSEV
jgi:putative flippase GtrA